MKFHNFKVVYPIDQVQFISGTQQVMFLAVNPQYPEIHTGDITHVQANGNVFD